MRNEWRTATVVQLCLAMRQERDYSACPILADALQDAGCPDDSDFLKELRGGRSELESERLVAIAMSEEGEAAVRGIEAIAEALGPNYGYSDYSDAPEVEEPMGYRELMEYANDWIASEEYKTQMGSESWRDTFPVHAEKFWKCFQIVTGQTNPHEDDSFFSCSC